ncbi:glutamine synthetase family protein [Streptomyces sp. NPDC057486]|uniref:glutamine synthetase family protein n=1 Tax=Streptomyces sp. NPDC057486 TaxID=3346145 RepID=UPI00369D5FD7
MSYELSSSRARVLFCDLLGLAHGRTVPAVAAKAPMHYCMTVMAQALDLRDDLVAGYGEDVGSPDMEALLDPSTLRPGWDEDTGIGVADLHRIGGLESFELDPRGLLRRAVAAWERETGQSPVAGFEMEFYELAAVPDAEGRSLRPVEVPAHRVYGSGLGGDPSGTGRLIHEAAIAAGLSVQALTGEFHPGQLEVVLDHQLALAAADEAFLFRELAREVAHREGRWITFLGKPFAGLAGSGLHLNLSATGTDGTNAFHAPDEPYGLSPTARHAIAGVLAHHRALCAVAAPNVNAYKRLLPGAIGHRGNWGLDHRLAAVRVPGERGAATRLEYRVADGGANPYLLTAAVLAAALLGVRNRLELPAPRDTGAATATSPANLSKALDALEADVELTELLGPEAVRTFTTLKRWEWEQWATAVTDWELRYYGRHF